jgi:hypothetical protein
MNGSTARRLATRLSRSCGKWDVVTVVRPEFVIRDMAKIRVLSIVATLVIDPVTSSLAGATADGEPLAQAIRAAGDDEATHVVASTPTR